MKFSEKIIIPLIIITLITAAACYYILEEYNKKDVEIKTGITSDAEEEGIMDDDDLKCEVTGILVGVNLEEGNITLRSVETLKDMQIACNETTEVYSKYKSALSLSQLELGEILDVTYSVHSKVADTLEISESAWENSNVTKFEINTKSRTIEVGDTMYRMEEDVVVSYGDKLAKLIDVIDVDTITVHGIGKKVYSIVVDKGHGYLRLDNDSYFVGGWIEVGQRIIKPISENMMLPVPEGKYTVKVTNHGYAGTDEVTINRDEETIVDLDKIEIEEVSIGHILFDIKPDYAQLYIDDEITEFEERVPLEYGVHKVHVELAGYVPVDTNIKVNSEYADISIELEREEEEEEEKTTSSSSSQSLITNATIPRSSGSSTTYNVTSPTASTARGTWAEPWATTVKPATTIYNTTATASSSSTSIWDYLTSSSSSPSIWDYLTSSSSESSSESSESTSSSEDSSSSSTEIISDNEKLYIDSPEGVEAFVDGTYIGVTPVACLKPTGTHIIVLYKEGYVPKSYTVTIDDDDNDVTFSFAELTEEE